jgi:hypothetical protein
MRATPIVSYMRRTGEAGVTPEPKYTDAQLLEIVEAPVCTGHERSLARSLLSERQAAMQGQGGEVVGTEDARERVMEAIAGALGYAFDCTRVWSAWSYGTMSEDDFSLVREDDGRLGEIADAAIAAIQPPQPVRSVSDEDARDAARYREMMSAHNLSHPNELIDTARYANQFRPDWWVGKESWDAGLDFSINAALEHDAAIAQEKQS